MKLNLISSEYTYTLSISKDNEAVVKIKSQERSDLGFTNLTIQLKLWQGGRDEAC